MMDSRRYDDARSTSEEYEVQLEVDGASTASISTTSNMFSGNSCFMGGSYYHVRGDAHFSSLFQHSFGAPNSRSPTISYHLS